MKEVRRTEYLEKLRGLEGIPAVKVITGMRRCGKTTILNQFAEDLSSRGVPEENIIRYNFDIISGRLPDYAALHNEIIGKASGTEGTVYVLLDEIQEVDGWERCVNSLFAEGGFDIYITGSNSKMLSGELATYLAGRYAEMRVYPFTFREYLEATGGNPEESFMKFMTDGGMPSAVMVSDRPGPMREMLRGIYGSVVLKDVISRNSVRDPDALDRVMKFLLSNGGRMVSANSVSRYLRNEKRGITVDTVINYIGFCEQAFLLHRVGRSGTGGKSVMKIGEKYYPCDHGLREAVVGGNISDRGQVLECTILTELLSRGYDVTFGDTENGEIDFVCEKDGKRLYIQAAWTIADPDTAEREFRSLLSVRDNYPKIVVTTDRIGMGRDGIKHMNVTDFLLGDF